MRGPFQISVIQTVRKLGYFVTKNVILTKSDLVLIAILSVQMVGGTMDYSADWSNMDEELDILGEEVMVSAVKGWKGDAKRIMEVETVKKMAQFIIQNAEVDMIMLVVAYADLTHLIAQPMG